MGAGSIGEQELEFILTPKLTPNCIEKHIQTASVFFNKSFIKAICGI